MQKTLNAIITRASISDTGRCIWVKTPNYTQKQTLQAINATYLYDNINRRSNYLKPDQQFFIKIKLNEAIYLLKGYCNDHRGDFYVNSDEWLSKININFEVGESLNCVILGINDF